MKATEQLRKLAQELREEAQELEQDKMRKCAQIIVAAQGLSTLQTRIMGDKDQ